MAYKIDDLPFEEFFVPVSKATAALVRLDERLARSPIREGMVERMHMHDAVVATKSRFHRGGPDGERVQIEGVWAALLASAR